MNSTAAIWSAIAASFAALSSFLIMLIQRRSLLESARPELVLSGWRRWARGQGDGAHEVLSFQTIKNVGHGTALHLYFASSADKDNYPLYGMSTIRLPILAANESTDVNADIVMWWKNVHAEQFKHLPIAISIWCFDVRGRRHETRYTLLAVDLTSGNTVHGDSIAPGVMLSSRTTTIRSVWPLKVAAQLRRMPGVGWLARVAAKLQRARRGSL